MEVCKLPRIIQQYTLNQNWEKESDLQITVEDWIDIQIQDPGGNLDGRI